MGKSCAFKQPQTCILSRDATDWQVNRKTARSLQLAVGSLHLLIKSSTAHGTGQKSLTQSAIGGYGDPPLKKNLTAEG